MNLVQILLPTADNAGRPFPPHRFAALRRELADRFGGVTVYSRGPAEGFWEGEGGPSRDDIVIFEVMCDDLDAAWWHERRGALEREFRQDEVIVRAQAIRLL